MRGDDSRRDGLFSYVRSEDRIPQGHPLRVIRKLANEALDALSPRFDELYAQDGRPSIPPEHLLRALLLQAFYSIRSERQLMEQLNYNLLFRWFVGLSMDDPVWVATVFSKNRDRLLDGDIAAAFLSAVLNLPRVKGLLSDEHVSVDGTLIQAWASMKSFRRKDGSDDRRPPGATGSGIFTGTNARTQHTPRPPTRMRAWRGRPTARRPSWLHRPPDDGEPQRPGGGRATDARHRQGGTAGGPGDAGRGAGRGAHDSWRGQGL